MTGLADALNDRPTTSAMNTAISTAISNLIDGAPETYDTLREIAEYIASDKTAMDTLNEAIGNKANKATTLAGYGITDAMTATAINKAIEDALATATGGESAADVKTALNNYKTSNDARVLCRAISTLCLRLPTASPRSTTLPLSLLAWPRAISGSISRRN